MARESRGFDSNIVQAILALGRLAEDRSVAVMAGAHVDYWLGRAILSRLRKLDDEEKEALLDGNGHGALATFSSKIWMGFALGLYDNEARADLLKVKKIRNEFAHVEEHVDFETETIAELCKRLVAPKYMAEASMKQEATIAKERFLDTIHHLVAAFHLTHQLGIHRPPKSEFLQY